MSGEIVRQDLGGWISGPSADAEPIAAEDIRAGDRLLLDDGKPAEVTDVRHSIYQFPPPDGQSPGVAIGWKSGTSSGLLFRKASDLLHRVTSQP